MPFTNNKAWEITKTQLIHLYILRFTLQTVLENQMDVKQLECFFFFFPHGGPVRTNVCAVLSGAELDSSILSLFILYEYRHSSESN